jgi:hypothetical protein
MKTFDEEFAREVLRCGEYIKVVDGVFSELWMGLKCDMRIRVIKYYPTKSCMVEPEYYWLKMINGDIVEFEEIGVN